jgi:hypothetical protein
MWPRLIVISHDVINYRLFGFIKIPITYRWYPFCFQTSEESFHWCVVPIITAAAHTLRDLITPKSLSEFPACVMCPLDVFLNVNLLFLCY